MPTNKSMKIVKIVKYVKSLVSHKKQLTPVRSHFCLVFHFITSCSCHSYIKFERNLLLRKKS